MNIEEKIQAIYKEMADKSFTLWCKIKVKYRAYYHNETGGEVEYAKEDNLIVWQHLIAENWEMGVSASDMINADKNWYIEDLETLVEIIGHPVVIWDVLRYCSSYISDWDDSVDSQVDLLSYWGDYRLPIEDQPEECIDFVYLQTLKS